MPYLMLEVESIKSDGVKLKACKASKNYARLYNRSICATVNVCISIMGLFYKIFVRHVNVNNDTMQILEMCLTLCL